MSKRTIRPISCIVPQDSIIVMQGDMNKVGQKTLFMMTRFLILRDNALFVYYNREEKMPYLIVPLRGLFVNPIKLDSRDGVYGFSLEHTKKNVKTRRFYSSNHELVTEWVRVIRQQAHNVSFDSIY
jgi:hypothetical protein